MLAQRATQAPDGAAHPSVVVPDVVSAMGQIAAAILDRVRAHSETTVIGITGSAGKTTTKDLLKSILEPEGPTVAPQGSYNGEVGVPLTIFTAELQTRYLVVEMGADAPGNIRDLAQMVRPDIGAVLMVGSAHAGKFGGADKIAAVKAELVEEIGADGAWCSTATTPRSPPWHSPPRLRSPGSAKPPVSPRRTRPPRESASTRPSRIRCAR
ncbi:hypothetical protein BG28_14105 [Nesterenkonia sp. AN1]|nr:hypothetical protein BG28_14105 [Nesterenkonia sp. AN1]